jgi:Family of unknown function (DUF6510)
MDERASGTVDERMGQIMDDPALDLMLDANAVAGLLATIFAAEVTACAGECAHCHTVSMVGTLRAWTRGPGVVLRCPACAQVVLRLAETPSGTLVDMSGLRHLRIPGAPGS